jgi:hypothetical protein
VTKRCFINRSEVTADQQKDKSSSFLYMTMKSNTNNDNENVLNYLEFYNSFKWKSIIYSYLNFSISFHTFIQLLFKDILKDIL